MAGASPARPRQLVLSVGVALAVGLASALALWPRVAPDRGPATTDDLEAWILERPESASLLIWDVEAGDALAAWGAERPRPVAGLTALLLAAEYARQAESGLDTAYQVPASALRRRLLPGVEPTPPDLGALTLPALARAAVGGHRAAADELLRILSRERVEAGPRQLELADLEPPLPVGGLLLSWAPAQWAEGTTPAEQAARFVRAPRAAQRDSAFAGERAFLNSAAVRAEETTRLQAHGLGLAPDETHTAARATFPRGTAQAYAELLTRAARGTLASPAVSARVLRSLRSSRSDSVRTASGAIAGLAAAAALVETEGRRTGAVLLIEGMPVEPEAQAAHALRAAELAERWARSPGRAGDLADR